MSGITDSMDMSLIKLQEIVKDREVWCAAVHGAAKIWTRLSDSTELIQFIYMLDRKVNPMNNNNSNHHKILAIQLH